MKYKNIFILLILLILGITNLGYTAPDIDFDALVQDFGRPGPRGISILDLPEKEIKILAEKDYNIVGFANFSDSNILKKKDKDEVVYYIQPGDSLYLIAIKYNVTVQDLKEKNNLDSDIIFIGQKLLIPDDTADDNSDQQPSPEPDNDKPLLYSVQPGDSLYLIAVEYNVTVQQIKQENDLLTDEIYIGQRLSIPLADENKDIPETPVKNGKILYYVQPGDSLYVIADRFDVTIEEIKKLNDLATDYLYSGQFIYIPSSLNNENKIIYFVQPGDSLYLLASKFNMTVESIKQINNLNKEVLYVGQKLYLNIPEITESKYNIVFSYYVKKGDSLISIADKFGLSVWDIRAYNNLEYDALYEGQKLDIPFQISSNYLTGSYQVNHEEMELLARAVYSEARGEPFNGQVAIAAVILNRVRHPFFPDNINDVIFQPWQFSAVHDGQFWLTPDQNAYLAVQAALQGWDPTKGAIYYYNPDTAKSEWVYYRSVIIEIGNHYFAV